MSSTKKRITLLLEPDLMDFLDKLTDLYYKKMKIHHIKVEGVRIKNSYAMYFLSLMKEAYEDQFPEKEWLRVKPVVTLSKKETHE